MWWSQGTTRQPLLTAPMTWLLLGRKNGRFLTNTSSASSVVSSAWFLSPWVHPIPEMLLFRKFPEIRKFQIEIRTLGKNETVSLYIKMIDQKGVKRFGKRKIYQNSLIENQNGNLLHTLVFSRVFQCSYYQRVNAATTTFRKFGIVPVAFLLYALEVHRHSHPGHRQFF